MDELLKYAIEGGSFGVSLFLMYFLFKRFVKKEVIEPIEEIQKDNINTKKSFEKFTENINSFIFRILKSHVDTDDRINKNMSEMNHLFTEATRHTSQSKIDSFEALKKVNVLEETADKLLKITAKVHEKNEKIESEVKQLSKDMIMIKNKTGVGKKQE